MEIREGTGARDPIMEHLRRALATQDFDALAGLYAEDVF